MTNRNAQTDWSQLTWPEIEELLNEGQTGVILPIGATEQHGPHLGVGMDSALAERLARGAAEATGVPCLPTIPYGCSLGHSHRWPGTLALRPQTLIEVIVDLGRWLFQSGFTRLFIVNGHVGNRSPLRCALEILRAECEDFKIAIFTTGTLSPRVQDAFDVDAKDWHANAAETSLMMHLFPDLVREDLLKDSDDPDRTENCVFAHPVNRTSKNGVTGKPSAASSEMGASLFEQMVEDLSEQICRGISERSPLDVSFQ
ncbi:creatininase family protein [Puniceicoccus vermicola]|uniref:Creatininase family protein n=1 Tax=Puniceicoccus vermicola TaxID=388746 RepID=A0A7X1AYQ5_9BACT|nr:creatininase family protein [Puniceicoccus vermicola]MBC2602427.1 creatininase family protein [Puniceicoccus vermicola]